MVIINHDIHLKKHDLQFPCYPATNHCIHLHFIVQVLFCQERHGAHSFILFTHCVLTALLSFIHSFNGKASFSFFFSIKFFLSVKNSIITLGSIFIYLHISNAGLGLFGPTRGNDFKGSLIIYTEHIHAHV